MEQFLPIIVIALISFLLNRSGEQKKRAANQDKKASPNNRPVQQREPERRMPPARETSLEKPEPVIIEKPMPDMTEKPRSLREAAEILLSQMQPQIEEKKQEAERKVKELQKEAEVYKKQAREIQIKTEARKEKKQTEPYTESFFQQSDIVKGIIMSEVLGPPRAKRRYGTRLK